MVREAYCQIYDFHFKIVCLCVCEYIDVCLLKVKVLVTFDPMDYSPLGSSVHGILQARILEWVVISFSNTCMHAESLQSCLTLRSHGQQPSGLLCPWDSLDKNTALGCHFLLPLRN